jgi:tetratricopeptide (TPR) repeat protein
MTLTEARKILGLGPDEDPRPHLDEFKRARERIAEMVRTAPNDALGDRFQSGLQEFDQALAAVREHLEALGLVPRPDPLAPRPRQEETPAITEALDSPADGGTRESARPRRGRLAWLAWLLVFLTGAAGGGLIYYKSEETKAMQRQIRITLLERIGSQYVENRRWQDAAAAFMEIDMLDPGSEVAALGHRSIEAGMAEEQTQFIGYWNGQAIAELDSGRLDEAEAAAKRVLEKYPADKDAAATLAKVAVARVGQSRENAIAAARKQLNERQWEAALSSAKAILASSPDEEEAKSILADATEALAKQAADHAKALSLLEQAAARDQGQFDQQALDWLREAASLAPDNAEIAARFEKMASYTRTLRVPGDFESLAEALASARDRDRVVLTEKTWKGPLVINAAIELQGAGPAKSVIECPAAEGSAITIGPDAKGARISGITFRHETFVADGADRFSAALVRGGGVTFVDCRFSEASGHGLVVIENGEAVASRCSFTDNGWNGAAAIGKGCVLEVRDSESSNNFENGIETWQGASATLLNNRCEGNSRNGIHADNGTAATTIQGNQLIANREFGLVLGSAGAGRITGNIARGNLLGGFVIRHAAATPAFTGNQATLNLGPGLVLERGLATTAYAGNTIAKNAKREILADADLSARDHHAEAPPRAVPVTN